MIKRKKTERRPPCPADTNGDGVVNSDDLSILASELGRSDFPHDEYYYFHNDHLGTPQRITDQSGTIAWSANYKPFGEASITTTTITNSFRFPGHYIDPETGLHYNYFRYYEPESRRYLRPDFIEDSVGANRFVYVDENPVNWVDFSGLARYFVFWKMKSPSAVIIPVGVTKIEGTVVSTKQNRYGTYDAIDFEGLFFGGALGPLPLAGTVNNQEYFEDQCKEPDLYGIESLSKYLAGTIALFKTGISGGGYQFGKLQGIKKTPSPSEGLDLGLDYMIGEIKTKGTIYQLGPDIFPMVKY